MLIDFSLHHNFFPIENLNLEGHFRHFPLKLLEWFRKTPISKIMSRKWFLRFKKFDEHEEEVLKVVELEGFVKEKWCQSQEELAS